VPTAGTEVVVRRLDRRVDGPEHPEALTHNFGANAVPSDNGQSQRVTHSGSVIGGAFGTAARANSGCVAACREEGSHL
jgi:hypothetical protein